MQHEETRIDELIDRYFAKTLTPAEMEELKSWLEDDEHLRYFLKRQNLYDACHPAFSSETINEERAYREIQARLRPVRRMFPWTRVAAAIAFLAIIIGGVFLFVTRENKITVRPVAQQVTRELPAVTLTLSSGEEIVLSDEKSREIVADSGTVARGDKKQLTYASSANVEDSVIYHELSVPRGGEFFLELSDKTKIWINAETTVRYPVKFARGERKIFVDGEAYLEVHRDTSAPFTVVMARNEVTVLGTAFNVNSYPDMEEDRVTLVSGKVRVYSGKKGEQLILSPGEQAVIQREEGQMTKRLVDTGIYCSWKNGTLVFQNNTLEEILRVLSRQYDVEVYWHDETLKRYTFSGELKRYDNIDEVLKLMGYTDDVKFTLHGKKIIVARP